MIGFQFVPEPEELFLQPCDIVFMRGEGWLTRAILRATQTQGEERSLVSHVGIVDVGGDVETAEILDAVNEVRRARLVDAYATGTRWVSIARPLGLANTQKAAILAVSRSMEGQRYGWGKLLLHLLDTGLGGRFVFRGMINSPKPICSWHVAKSFRAVGIDFDVPVASAQPDDIWDYCRNWWAEFCWPIGADLLALEHQGSIVRCAASTRGVARASLRL